VNPVRLHDLTAGLAIEAHSGQKDALGRDYCGRHVADVVRRVEQSHGRSATLLAVAWLHDVVEDTTTTLDDLRDEGLPDDVVNAVDAITRRAGEQYAAYIERVRLNPIARIVKLADNAQNLADNEALRAVDPVKAASLKRRYLAARERLEETS